MAQVKIRLGIVDGPNAEEALKRIYRDSQGRLPNEKERWKYPKFYEFIAARCQSEEWPVTPYYSNVWPEDPDAGEESSQQSDTEEEIPLAEEGLEEPKEIYEEGRKKQGRSGKIGFLTHLMLSKLWIHPKPKDLETNSDIDRQMVSLILGAVLNTEVELVEVVVLSHDHERFGPIARLLNEHRIQFVAVGFGEASWHMSHDPNIEFIDASEVDGLFMVQPPRVTRFTSVPEVLPPDGLLLAPPGIPIHLAKVVKESYRLGAQSFDEDTEVLLAFAQKALNGEISAGRYPREDDSDEAGKTDEGPADRVTDETDRPDRPRTAGELRENGVTVTHAAEDPG